MERQVKKSWQITCWIDSLLHLSDSYLAEGTALHYESWESMKILKFLDKYIEEYLLIFTTVATVLVLFLQVVTRFIFDFSLVWTEELARYLFIWMTFIGVSYAVKKDKHLRIDSLPLLFGGTGKFVIRTIANLLFFFFALVVLYYGGTGLEKVGRTTPGLGISYIWVYASILVGFFLTAIRLIQDQISIMSARRVSGVDEE